MSLLHNDTIGLIESYLSGIITHIAVSSSYDIPDQNTPLEGEIGRVAVDSIKINGNSLEILGTLDTTDAITLETTISSVTDEYVFELDDVTGLSINDRIAIKLSTGYEQKKIQNISSNEITLFEPLSQVPQVGDLVKQMISRLHVIANGTLTLNDGEAVVISPYPRFKGSGETIPLAQIITIK